MIKRTESEKIKSKRRINILLLVIDFLLVAYVIYVLIVNLGA